ncbi:Hcp family type VI secretion system effector [Neorhizobium sp. T786]|uniref:Hcp family type VI secretion system effector n=1 Tax=Pseudorhizobium xiangyangii TaxID=2883104 RepID=UPI001CFFA25C|nr:Hcp family type VI secretion system effector [Neorhizobium xiangyangii]MCB5205260.1 Hcp family type VI secretion system effector [Neorhizobium xiangyangii]
MPTPAYISIEGATQGPITQGAATEDSIGNIWQEGHEDQILVQGVDHIVTIPRDPQSGQPSGQRVHKPFKFISSLNKSTPLLYNALTSGEMLTKCEIKWYRTNTAGKQEHFFTTKLEDALVVDIDCCMPHVQDPKNADFTQLITVSLSYRKITWEHTVAGTSGADDWRAPKA